MSLAPGAYLGAHEILGLLGSGGMGEVYLALDTSRGARRRAGRSARRPSTATLRLCFDLSGAARPAAFISPFGSRFLLATDERAPVHDSQPLTDDTPSHAHAARVTREM